MLNVLKIKRNQGEPMNVEHTKAEDIKVFEIRYDRVDVKTALSYLKYFLENFLKKIKKT